MNAYVLIGGRSRRMGISKVELFLERIVQAAQPVFDEVVAVDRPSPGDDASQTVLSRQVRVLHEEPHEDEAAIFGVVRALRDAGQTCFLLAVDYPLITTGVLRFLRDDGRVPVWNGEAQPLCAVWDAAALPRIESRIAARRYDLRGAIEREMIAEGELRAKFTGEPLLNVNTPEEWERGQRLLSSR